MLTGKEGKECFSKRSISSSIEAQQPEKYQMYSIANCNPTHQQTYYIMERLPADKCRYQLS